VFRIAEHRADAGAHAFVVRIDREHPGFAGHFPGHPVLPAIGQLVLLDRLLARCDPGHRGIVEVDPVRFQAPVEPGSTLTVAIRLDGDAARFTIHREGRPVARGSLARLREDA
jgi:3-hydroxymyristoyl/3-hydroxydecanoyl-(acyl carrier protein) dehydratase